MYYFIENCYLFTDQFQPSQPCIICSMLDYESMIPDLCAVWAPNHIHKWCTQHLAYMYCNGSKGRALFYLNSFQTCPLFKVGPLMVEYWFYTISILIIIYPNHSSRPTIFQVPGLIRAITVTYLRCYAPVNVNHQGPMLADPGNSDIWKFLPSKSSTSFVPFVSEYTPKFPTPRSWESILNVRTAPLVWISLS